MLQFNRNTEICAFLSHELNKSVFIMRLIKWKEDMYLTCTLYDLLVYERRLIGRAVLLDCCSVTWVEEVIERLL